MCQFILLFAVHLCSLSMFRFIASVCRTVVSSTTAGSLSILFVLIFGGFLIPHRKAKRALSFFFLFFYFLYVYLYFLFKDSGFVSE